MPRTARIVVPDVPHHIVQRGNRKQAIFHSDADRRAYLGRLADSCQRFDVKCLTWCLMDNHIHLILTPKTMDGLRAVLSSTNTWYSQRVNLMQGASGHLFQGRYASYPMDDAHLMVAARYIENNPVTAGMVRRAEDWPWSSARAHISGRPDGLVDVAVLGKHVIDWSMMLRSGLEATEWGARIDQSLRRGEPLGGPDWLRMHGLSESIVRKPRGRPARIK